MRWTTKLRLRLRSLFRSTRVEQELGEELQYHLERLEDDFVAGGMSRAEAQFAARREMGAIEQRKEECRDARGLLLIESTRQDIGYALRGLRKSPGFTVVAILSLALGIGANTALFSLWNGVLHASLPAVEKPGELVILTDPNESGGWTGNFPGARQWVTYAEFEELRDRADVFSHVMASQSGLETWSARSDDGAPEDVKGRFVSGGYFETLGVPAAIGRVFSAEEDRRETPIAVISHRYWQRRFGGGPDVLGKTLAIRDSIVTIVGVTAPGFIGETIGQQPDLWLPLRLQPRVSPPVNRLRDAPPQKRMWLHLFARLKPGVTHPQAEAQANAIFMAGLLSFYGALVNGEHRREILDQRLEVTSAARGASPSRQSLSQPLMALLAGVGVLLLIACANLANLLLARGAARKHEIALRLSIGATRGRLIRQHVTESLVLATIGGVAAMAVASVLHGALVALLARSDEDFSMSFAVDPLMLIFVLGATVASAVLFGMLPAWQATRVDGASSLNEQSRGAIGTVGQVRSGRWLVSAQLALSLPLLVGAGLMARTVFNLQTADLGFPAERLLLVRANLRDVEAARRDAVRRELLDEIRRMPGVSAATHSQLGIFSGGESMATVAVDGFVPRTDEERSSAMDVAGAGYFSALGVPIILGRDLLDSDRAGAPAVCVINEAFAARFFAGRSPVGLRVKMARADQWPTYQVVGVAGNARTADIRGEVEPRFYIPDGQAPAAFDSSTLLIRAVASAGPVTEAARKAIQRLGGRVVSTATMEEQMAPLISQDRTTAQLAVVFGGLALALAAIGLYGVLSYGVARRTSELAIRVALGARPGSVVVMILRETTGLVIAGLALGGGLAYASSRLIDSRLYGVSAQDPLTLLLATGLLLAVALGAAFIPAKRASKLDPMTALR
jgi:predicted permease